MTADLQRVNEKVLTGIVATIASVILVLPMSFVQGFSATHIVRPIPSRYAISASPALSVCQFHPANKSWEGSCGKLFGASRTLTITPAKTITTGVWRKGATPTSVWAGDMTESGSQNWPIEVEVYDEGSGVLRTEYGWFLISGFELTPKIVRFQINTSHEVPPNELDREIIERAAAILSTESAWNRADTRKCAATDMTWSIYCAMQRATKEVTGGFHHRRPALQVVRQIVDERTAGRDYHHRLMDYNNDPSTKLENVRSLFADALTRISRQSPSPHP